jgi:hypothetical protein
MPLSLANGSVQLPGFRDICPAARLLHFQLRISSIAKSASEVGIESNGLTVIGNRPVVVAFSHISETATVKGVGGSRVQPDYLAEIGNRSVVVAFPQICAAPIVKELGIVGIESNGLAVIGNRSVDFTFSPISQAAVVKGAGGFGIQSDGLVEIGNRSVVNRLFSYKQHLG